jgi:hypothetical protein
MTPQTPYNTILIVLSPVADHLNHMSNHCRQFTWLKSLTPLAGSVGLLVASSAPSLALTFNLTPTFGMNSLAIAGFQSAANRWSNILIDPVTVNLDVGFTPLSLGVLGQTGSTQQRFTYASVKNALTLDQTSIDDNTAVANLQPGNAFALLLNRTSNNPNGSKSSLPYLDNDGDANNTTINMTTANAKALGLSNANSTGQDAQITFSSSFSWDFDPTNGITEGLLDFVGIATHEIGHALGFMSGVDILDQTPGLKDNRYNDVSTLDLFRYSTLSSQKGYKVIDWTADTRSKYFSIDGGVTKLGGFSTGKSFGDGRQASHWKDNQGLGIMDPTSAPGERLTILPLDIQAFDVIGWNRASVTQVSNPTNLGKISEFSNGVQGSDASDTTQVPEPDGVLGLMIAVGFGSMLVKSKP